MSTPPTPPNTNGIDEVISEVQGLESQVSTDQQTIAGENATIQTENATILTLQQTIATLQAQIAAGSSAFVADGMEQTQWLLAGGTAANTNQTGSTADAIQTTPGINGCASLQIIPAGPWADKYWYKAHGPRPDKAKFKYEFSFMFPTAADSAAAHCVELDIQQSIGGQVFNCGLQFGFDNNAIKIWNRSLATPANLGGGEWIPIGQACPRWPAASWTRGIWECHRDAGNVYYDALTFNNIRFPLKQFSFPAPNLGLGDVLDCAVQLDSNSVGAKFSILLDNMRFTAS